MGQPKWTVGVSGLELRKERGWTRQDLPHTLGAGRTKSIQLESGLSYIETCYTPSRDLRIFSRMEHDAPRLVVTVGLAGRSLFTDGQCDDVVFRQGYTTITAFRSSCGERRYAAGQSVSQLRFSIGREWLERYFERERTAPLFAERAGYTVCHQPTTVGGVIAAREILGHDVARAGGSLQLHGLALSLLAAELGAACERNHSGHPRFAPRELAIAQRARDILRAELRDPPSVGELARRVGVNQLKLKQLFHHIYQDTPYGVLTAFRMQEAYRLLESTRCPVSFAAGLVGYGHASNFSAAFVKYFGVTPKSVAKKS